MGKMSNITFSDCQQVVELTMMWNKCYEEWSSTSSLLDHDGLINHMLTISMILGKATNLAQSSNLATHALHLCIYWSLQFLYMFQLVFTPNLFRRILEQYLQPGGKVIVDQQWPKLSSAVHTITSWIINELNQWQATTRARKCKQNSHIVGIPGSATSSEWWLPCVSRCRRVSFCIATYYLP